jgi:DNA polymerase I-like protein with 3'-5' exonuclease and polymerase domains
MAKIINTATTMPTDMASQWELDQVYNGTDVLAPRMVWDTIHPMLGPETSATYDFSRALQGPTMEMALRGCLVDQRRRTEVVDEFFDKIDTLERNLARIVLDGVGMAGFNWRSSADLKVLFYDRLGIPPIMSRGKPTVDRAARDKMMAYLIARPICAHINAISELAKKINVLQTKIDNDGRVRTSYNITGTDTGRFSSSFSAFGTGGNLQNIEESLRSIFISDPGYKFAKCDAKSGESFIVGAIEWNIFGDPTYLDACNTGDPHTAAARLCWPHLSWTGDLKQDKALADNKDAPFYRHHTHRQVTKKLGHASNYGGMPPTIAEQTGLPLELVQAFQPVYFRAFPAHQEWQLYVAQQIATRGFIVNLTGRKRWFWGRRTDPNTVRAAIAYDPQGSLADIVNRAMLHIWKQHYVIIMFQDHDAITFMYPEAVEDELIPRIMADLVVRVPLANGRELAIPYDCKVGWNKGDYDPIKNPEGLKDYQGTEQRQREAQVGLLDRPIRRAHR